MALYAFHRILITAAILFDFVFTVFCIRKYNRSGDAWELVWGLASSLLTLGLVAYLVHFNRKTSRLRLELAARDRLCPRCQYDLRGSLASDIAQCLPPPRSCGVTSGPQGRRSTPAARASQL
jgi:hypothetical protein